MGVAAYLLRQRKIRRRRHGHDAFGDLCLACWRCWCRCKSCWATCTVSTPCTRSPPSWPPLRPIGSAKPGRRWRCSPFPTPRSGEKRLRFIEVPLLGSLILTHDVNGVVPGLKDFPKADRPPVTLPFFAFPHHGWHRPADAGAGAVGVGCLRLRGRLYDRDWYLRALMIGTPLGFVAVVAGWTTTEVGRQPWTVYGVMRTAASVTPSLTGMDVLISLLTGYTRWSMPSSIPAATGGWWPAVCVRSGVHRHQDAPVQRRASRRAGQAAAGRRRHEPWRSCRSGPRSRPWRCSSYVRAGWVRSGGRHSIYNSAPGQRRRPSGC